MTSTQDPTPEARANVTEHNVETRADLLPEEQAAGSVDPEAQAAAILAESEERTLHPDADEGGHRTSEETV
ncbi:hypothetical protein ASG36_01910 [Geodermatophilus sp. Leaf369]|uniref:hypothetical protein n=1 Tax=Geodermatophilus sp. Leaf369 TaxID=1736354 RepID=UPI0006FCDDB0|nr:hypothetical protein [Geodermatophilus sp. Leaf369]KQS59824.1 hypothetical protein ASG36_01910 [Geodermatophilus sp. Leaf369]